MFSALAYRSALPGGARGPDHNVRRTDNEPSPLRPSGDCPPKSEWVDFGSVSVTGTLRAIAAGY